METSPRKWADYRANLFRTCESNMGELATCPTRQHATYRNPSIGPAMTATIAIKLTERNARVSFKLTARTYPPGKAWTGESSGRSASPFSD